MSNLDLPDDFILNKGELRYSAILHFIPYADVVTFITATFTNIIICQQSQ